MTIILDGSSLTIEKLVAIAHNNEKVELAPEALKRIKICRAMLEDKLGAGKPHWEWQRVICAFYVHFCFYIRVIISHRQKLFSSHDLAGRLAP